jgi:hypothetical protein
MIYAQKYGVSVVQAESTTKAVPLFTFGWPGMTVH